MNITDLINLAKKNSGMSLGQLANELSVRQARLSEWKSGERKPDANEIAFFADKAGLPVLETVAEIEEQFDPRFSHIWAKALGNLRAAGVAASVMCLPLIYSMIEMINDAQNIAKL